MKYEVVLGSIDDQFVGGLALDPWEVTVRLCFHLGHANGPGSLCTPAMRGTLEL